MFNLSEPVSNLVIIGSIIFILLLTAIALAVVEVFKRKMGK